MTDFLFNRDIRLEFTDRDNPLDVITIGNPEIEGQEPLKITGQVEKQLSLEPNVATLAIYNLSDPTAAAVNFRKPILEFGFGRKVEIFAGYVNRVRKIFSGVVISAITTKEAPFKITRIEARNIFYELMQLPVNRSFGKGDSKSNAVLSILKDIGASLESKAVGVLKERLSGQKFTETTNFTGTAYNIINQINRGLLGVVNVYFDDIATSFNPVGIPLDEPPIIYDATKGQIIGAPEPTEIGADFKVLLDNELRISSPVRLESDTIRSFFPSGRFVVKQVIHTFSNRADEPFESRVISVFDRTNLDDQLFQIPIV